MTWIGPLYFYICASLAILGGVATIACRNPIRGVMGLLLTIVAMAGLFLALHAQFLAAVQLIVYAGAIVVLFLFVIMLLGENMALPQNSRGIVIRSIGGTLFALSGFGLLFLFAHRFGALPPPRLPLLGDKFGSIDEVGRVLFTQALVPFELSSALLIVAAVGAIAIAKGKPAGRKRGDAQP